MEKENCAILKAINLPAEKFERFKNDFMREYEFVNSNIGLMKDGTNDNYWGCILVMPEDSDEGIICHRTSRDSPLYTSYLPSARGWYMYQSEMSDALRDFETYMQSAAEYLKTIAIDENLGGRVEFNRDSVENLYSDGYPLNFFILAEMLMENSEIENATIEDDTLKIRTTREIARYPDKFLDDTMDDELAVKYANHLLSNHTENQGAVFDLSNHTIHNVDFSNYELNGAKFKNATFKNCKFKNTSLCFASFENAKFTSCDFEGATAEESDFTNADFIDCSMKKAILTHSKFGDASMDQCKLNHASFVSCYAERFKRTNCQEFGTDFSEQFYDMESFEGTPLNDESDDEDIENFGEVIRREFDYEED